MPRISCSLGEFPRYWDWLWCPGLSPVLVSIALPFAFDLVFSIRSYMPLDFNRVSSLRPTYCHPFGRGTFALTHFLGEFPGLGLALVPDVVVTEAEQRCAWSRKLDPNFCPGLGRTSDLGIYRAPLLLIASYDMQEATAGQF